MGLVRVGARDESIRLVFHPKDDDFSLLVSSSVSEIPFCILTCQVTTNLSLRDSKGSPIVKIAILIMEHKLFSKFYIVHEYSTYFSSFIAG